MLDFASENDKTTEVSGIFTILGFIFGLVFGFIDIYGEPAKIEETQTTVGPTQTTILDVFGKSATHLKISLEISRSSKYINRIIMTIVIITIY